MEVYVQVVNTFVKIKFLAIPTIRQERNWKFLSSFSLHYGEVMLHTHTSFLWMLFETKEFSPTLFQSNVTATTGRNWLSLSYLVEGIQYFELFESFPSFFFLSFLIIQISIGYLTLTGIAELDLNYSISTVSLLAVVNN